MTNNTFGPSHKIKESKSASETDLTSHYVFFYQEAFDDFKDYCQKNKDKLKANEFIKDSLTAADIKKFEQAEIPNDLVMKIFIAINHTAGYDENSHIGLKIFEKFDQDFALKWFQLRAASAHIASSKNGQEIISMSTFANSDGNIFGANRNSFKGSLGEREAVVLAQLQSALSKISTLKEDDKIKQSIQNLIDQITDRTYPTTPNDEQIKQATQAITYANLINAMHSVPKDSVMLYSRPNLFLPNINEKEKCKLTDENFETMVQEVVNATGRPIIVEQTLYQKDKKATQLTTEEIELTNADYIKLIAQKLQEQISGAKLIIGMNGAVHQMTPGRIQNWQPTVGRNFIEGRKLALEELLRKFFQKLPGVEVGKDVKITAELGSQKLDIGFAKYGDRKKQSTAVAETPQSTAVAEPSQPSAVAEPLIEGASTITTCCGCEWFYKLFSKSR
jgi:Txe/YoeB family toxin of Txe-Axe toxin-antitoxin module